MKKTLITLSLLIASSSALAESTMPENPVMRPITLTDGTAVVAGGVVYGNEADDSRGEAFVNLAYGITDDFTVGFGGLSYKFLSRNLDETGLDMAVSIGSRGFHESTVNGDSKAYGLDVHGKYVIDSDLAVTFGFGGVIWDEDILENKSEYRYSVGVMRNLNEDFTLRANYTFRDLKDFTQDNAHVVNAGINYTYSKNLDLGVFATYSDFDAKENGYKLDDSFDEAVGIYAAYRF